MRSTAHEAPIPSTPVKFREAVAAWRKRDPMPKDEYDALDEEARDRAWTVAAAAQADLVTDVWEAIDSAIENGDTLEDFQDAVGDQLAEAWGGAQPYRVETIFRTNVNAAYNEGRHSVFTAPAVKEARPYWRFDVIDDDRLDDVCADCGGVVLSQDDPWWDDHLPPLHFSALAEGARITTARGERRIESLVAGDLVLTHRGRLRPVYVVMSKRPDAPTCLRVELSTGRVLTISKEHPVLVADGWKPAGDLKCGDKLFEHGKPVRGVSDETLRNPKDFPAPRDEGAIAYDVARFARRPLMLLPVDLQDHRVRYEREISDPRLDRILRLRAHAAAIEQRGRGALHLRRPAAKGLRQRSAHALARVAIPRRVCHRHPIGVPHVDRARRLAQAEGPMISAAAAAHGGRGDRSLLLLRADLDPMALAPRREHRLSDLHLALERSQRRLPFPMPLSYPKNPLGAVPQIDWCHSTIISIAAVPIKVPLWNLGVLEDETFVAEGQIVHNCRCSFSALSAEEAGEDVDDEGPDSAADDGFGEAPDEEGEDWEPDASDYPADVGDILEGVLDR